MTEPLYYEDIEVGSEVPPLTKQPDSRQLVMWAGASGDYNPIHYDKDFALSSELPGIVVQGQLVCSFLGQLMTDWIGDSGQLRKITCNYRGMNFPGESIICKGKVTQKYAENKEHYVECTIWAENARAEKTVTGTATVIVPSRAS
ncbi:MaoC/PaaZ C-terminal domain-containing protein [Chloroflexota bacterium]